MTAEDLRMVSDLWLNTNLALSRIKTASRKVLTNQNLPYEQRSGAMDNLEKAQKHLEAANEDLHQLVDLGTAESKAAHAHQ